MHGKKAVVGGNTAHVFRPHNGTLLASNEFCNERHSLMEVEWDERWTLSINEKAPQA